MQKGAIMIVLHNLNTSRRPKFGKNVGFACHIRLGVKLCSNNERNCVFRCVVSAAHLFHTYYNKKEKKENEETDQRASLLMLNA